MIWFSVPRNRARRSENRTRRGERKRDEGRESRNDTAGDVRRAAAFSAQCRRTARRRAASTADKRASKSRQQGAESEISVPLALCYRRCRRRPRRRTTTLLVRASVVLNKIYDFCMNLSSVYVCLPVCVPVTKGKSNKTLLPPTHTQYDCH